MQCGPWLCVFITAVVLVVQLDAKKSFSLGRRSSNRRTSSSQQKPPPQPQPATPHRTETTNTNFLNFERGGSSHGSGNTHVRGDPFKPAPQAPKPPPQSSAPIGFDKVNQGQKPIGFDKVNSEAQRPPAYNPSYPGKPAASAPNPGGPPPAYPGYGGSHGGAHGGYEAPPAYPGRPVNAPPVYSANNPSFGQSPGQHSYSGYTNQQGGIPNQQGNYHQGGYPQQQGGYHQSAYPQQQGGYHQSAYPQQQGGYQSAYPQQQGFSYPGQSYSGQQNSWGNPGHYQNQGFGNPSGGFGQSYQGYGGNSFGGSAFGQSNPYGGSPFGQQNHYGGSPFGQSNSFGGSSFGGGLGGMFGGSQGRPNYSPNNFGYSSNPGFFGSQGFSGGYNSGYGYHKRSRFGGLPIPIPIPIPLGMFGGFGGGRSHNHRVLDTFVKDRNVSTSDNETTAVFVLNNSTITPCTTDQFIYNNLNVTVMSCTAGNCTAIKVFTTTNVTGEVAEYSAGITMCMEPKVTYSSFANNANPTVSDLHTYQMRVCRDVISTNSSDNVTDQANVTVKITETLLNESVIVEGNTTTDPSLVPSSTPVGLETSTVDSENTTVTPTTLNFTSASTTEAPIAINSNDTSKSSTCEIFDCAWIEMCLTPVEIVDRCETPDCPFTRTGYQPCVKIKMCQSPGTPLSTFATLNNTISRIDEFNNITSVNDLANLTLISYIPPMAVANCSQNATDPECQPPGLTPSQEGCVPSNSTEVVLGASSTGNNATLCSPEVLDNVNSARVVEVTTEASSVMKTR